MFSKHFSSVSDKKDRPCAMENTKTKILDRPNCNPTLKAEQGFLIMTKANPIKATTDLRQGSRLKDSSNKPSSFFQ